MTSQSTATTSASFSASRAGLNSWQKAIAIAAGSLLTALCAHVSIPLFFTPVPLTLQPFPILLLGLLLGPSAAFLSLALYLLEGAAGLPVFTPGAGGMIQLLGPTGGYLLAYPFAAAATGWLRTKLGPAFAGSLAAAALGSIIVLGAGAMWLGTVTHLGMAKVWTMSILPFLPGDALKAAAAAGIAAGWTRWRRVN
ncbi:biotin transporter BioY [Acidipila rosea]|uniref:Biotin transporter n=1 Tax=Acidipila rosea TaxID=768535 RepID=A0A4R1L8Q1_9BACT|nr:biotin transporter BioY [Acidipila rosea]MBW4026688.1 biotin transporter BioY [Acidobacteriota bacterium]MBW4044865.1 biotin transporter BioY [Acidobacteriota bacterium]TCK73570.1 biotin transport system substrate-specific component [Acidipila rosea]